ncbi:MAG TPA: M36 family metallopeptidase [Vicinamibacteria bacterium]|nr:M36 family metallopeptidase [Vicinamibacteria bacterium]
MRKTIRITAFVLAWMVPSVESTGQNRPTSFRTSQPSSRDPMEIALDFVRGEGATTGVTAADLSEVGVLSRSLSRQNQTTHIHLRQRLGGIEVANANANINIDRDGRVINAEVRFVARLAQRVNRRSPQLSAATAILAASRELGLSSIGTPLQLQRPGGRALSSRYAGNGLSLDPIPVRLAYYALDSGEVRLTWQMLVRTLDQLHWWNLWVDAETGNVLDKADWVANDTYRVLALPLENPDDGQRTSEVNPADALASPFGWHDTNGATGAEFTITWGNNVRAQEDTDANNTGGFSPSGGAGLTFDFPFDDTRPPSTYQSASITNLFYWNNILHDIHYQYGFDEANGAFQQNNYGRSKNGAGDPVIADSQDGSGTNNANFATPPDGFAGRMQMFLWTPPNDHAVVVNSPNKIARTYIASGAAFGPALDTTGNTGNVVLVVDSTGSTSDGCDSLTNAAAISGNIAIIDRGTCTFVTKVRNVQNAGAVAAIIVNHLSDTPFTMGDDGTATDITISSVMIGLSDGQKIKGALPGVNATVKVNPNAPARRDSSFDDGVIIHEYGHGVSNRLTGGPRNVNCLNGSQSGGMGEGWSDWWALVLTAKSGNEARQGTRGIGNYVTYQRLDGVGIRSFPYSTDLTINPLTYGDAPATGGQVHAMGTIWASALWDMYWNLVNARGFNGDFYDSSSTDGNIVAIQLVMDGLKLQPCNPTFLDARDAILLADLNDYGGANQCSIWRAFAKRGMGVNAKGGNHHNDLNVTEDFSVPAACQAN